VFLLDPQISLACGLKMKKGNYEKGIQLDTRETGPGPLAVKILRPGEQWSEEDLRLYIEEIQIPLLRYPVKAGVAPLR